MPKSLAQGTKSYNTTQVSANFDPETFEQIREFALRKRTSFNEALRLLVEWGLEIAQDKHG